MEDHRAAKYRVIIRCVQAYSTDPNAVQVRDAMRVRAIGEIFRRVNAIGELVMAEDAVWSVTSKPGMDCADNGAEGHGQSINN